MLDAQDIEVVVVGLAVAELLALVLVADAVMRPRSSQGAIAWSIGLIAAPFVAIPLYLVFGRTRFEGYAEAVRDAEDRVADHVAAWRSSMKSVAPEPCEELAEVETLVGRLTGLPFTRGNRLTLLRDGEATYAAMLDAIATASAYVLVQFYIVRDDGVGRRLRDALVERARSGIRVHFLYDEIGSWALPGEYLATLRDAGVEVSGFKTTRGLRNRFQINFRNHRKLLVVDGRTGFIGGLNLGDEYLGYRDTHLRIDGPAAQQIQVCFLGDWYWARRAIPEVDVDLPQMLAEDRSVAIVGTGPADRLASCSLLCLTLIATARRRLWLTSPYFVPDDVCVRALQGAALRGVDVRILLPAKADNRVVELASYTYYAAMLDCGVRLYRYQERFMHQKVVLVDDALAGVGTVNLDNRSLYLNFEATALVADEAFAARVAEMLEADLERSATVALEHFARKPLPFKVAARLARLASPLL